MSFTQAIENDPIDQIVDKEQEDNVEQPIEQSIEQQVPQEDGEATLRRSTRVKRSTIPSDYVVYIEESNYNIGVVNDPEMFS